MELELTEERRKSDLDSADFQGPRYIFLIQEQLIAKLEEKKDN